MFEIKKNILQQKLSITSKVIDTAVVPPGQSHPKSWQTLT